MLKKIIILSGLTLVLALTLGQGIIYGLPVSIQAHGPGGQEEETSQGGDDESAPEETTPQSSPLLTAESLVFPSADGEGYTSIGQFIGEALLPYAIALASIGAVVMIAVAGNTYVSSGGSPEAVGEAKEIIIGALLGLAVIVLAGLFIRTFVDINQGFGGGTETNTPAETGVGAGGSPLIQSAPDNTNTKYPPIDSSDLNFKGLRQGNIITLSWDTLDTSDVLKLSNNERATFLYRIYQKIGNGKFALMNPAPTTASHVINPAPTEESQYYLKVFIAGKNDPNPYVYKSVTLKDAGETTTVQLPTDTDRESAPAKTSSSDKKDKPTKPKLILQGSNSCTSPQVEEFIASAARVKSPSKTAKQDEKGTSQYVRVWWSPIQKTVSGDIVFYIYDDDTNTKLAPSSDNFYFDETEYATNYRIKAFIKRDVGQPHEGQCLASAKASVVQALDP